MVVLRVPRTKWPWPPDYTFGAILIAGGIAAVITHIVTHNDLWATGVFSASIVASLPFGDWQWRKVYAWTRDLATVDGGIKSEEDLQEIATAALKAYGSHGATVLKQHPPKGGNGSSSILRRVVWVNPDNASPVYLLHEVAHLIATDVHGPQFARILRDLAVHFGGVSDDEADTAASRRHVRMAPPP